MSHVMVIKIHLLSHKWIFVERVPEKVYVPIVLEMTIYFLLQKYWLNHWLIGFLSNCLEWVDSIQHDSDQCESSRNLCGSKLHNLCAQNFQLQNYFRAQHFRKCCCLQGFHFHFLLCHVKKIFCRIDLTSLWYSQRGRSCFHCYYLGLWFLRVLVGSP